jgi:hypothetical protein
MNSEEMIVTQATQSTQKNENNKRNENSQSSSSNLDQITMPSVKESSLPSVKEASYRFDVGPSLLLLPDVYEETFKSLGTLCVQQ